MRFQLEGEPFFPVAGGDELTELIKRIDGGFHNFGILENEAGHFIQAALRNEKFVIEKQLGGLNDHYEAIPATPEVTDFETRSFLSKLFTRRPKNLFELDDVLKAFEAFMGLRPEPTNMKWRKINL